MAGPSRLTCLPLRMGVQGISMCSHQYTVPPYSRQQNTAPPHSFVCLHCPTGPPCLASRKPPQHSRLLPGPLLPWPSPRPPSRPLPGPLSHPRDTSLTGDPRSPPTAGPPRTADGRAGRPSGAEERRRGRAAGAEVREDAAPQACWMGSWKVVFEAAAAERRCCCFGYRVLLAALDGWSRHFARSQRVW